jgi:hypothetical protein
MSKPYNSTRKGRPIKPKRERSPKNSALKGLETDEPGDECDYRDGQPFVRFQNVCLAFLRSQWEDGVEVSMGAFGRALNFHERCMDAITMLTASRSITVTERGPRSFITAGPGMPVDEPQPRYGDVQRRESIYTRIPEGVVYVDRPMPSPWDRLSGVFKRKDETV